MTPAARRTPESDALAFPGGDGRCYTRRSQDLLVILWRRRIITAGNTELLVVLIMMLIILIGALCATGIFFWVWRKERQKNLPR